MPRKKRVQPKRLRTRHFVTPERWSVEPRGWVPAPKAPLVFPHSSCLPTSGIRCEVLTNARRHTNDLPKLDVLRPTPSPLQSVGSLQDELGFRVLASELPSFLVDRDSDTVENCRRRVQDEADLMVLVIGGRYGSIPDSRTHSVTNLEYLTARAKGIPVFAFVQADVLAVLPTWESNRNADFTRTVDTPELFVFFLKQVRSVDNVWMFPFTTAQEIAEVLRMQLAYLAKRGLDLQAQLRGSPEEYQGLTGVAFRIALERPAVWQGRLFAQLVREEIASASDLRRAYESGLAFGVGEGVSDDEAPVWAQECLGQVLRLSAGLTVLVNDLLNAALNANDPRQIAYGARELGRAYKEALEWAQRIRRAHVEDEWVGVTRELSLFTRNIVIRLETLPDTLDQRLDEALAAPTDSPRQVHMDFTVEIYNLDGYTREFAVIARRRGLPGGRGRAVVGLTQEIVSQPHVQAACLGERVRPAVSPAVPDKSGKFSEATPTGHYASSGPDGLENKSPRPTLTRPCDRRSKPTVDVQPRTSRTAVAG